MYFLAGKPIALCCIAPILAAKVFGSEGVQLTLGKKGDESKWPYGGALDAATALGAKVVEKNVDEVHLSLFFVKENGGVDHTLTFLGLC